MDQTIKQLVKDANQEIEFGVSPSASAADIDGTPTPTGDE